MEDHAFDRMVKRLAARNISRRATVRPGGGFTQMATAQGVTASPAMASAAPVVTLASTSFLFVQNFSGVRIETKPASIP